MAYGRGGIFRSRFIAPAAQRATEILSKPLISQAKLEFDAGTANTTTSVPPNGTISLPLTVASAAGQERLVIVGALSTLASADFVSCTIDGQAATRVGTVSRGVGSGARVFLTAFRAPGTANTSINVSLTSNTTATMTATFAACWKMNFVGSLAAQVASSANDPTLSVNTANKGSTAGGVIGYGPASPFTGATDAFVWTGLTERYEYHAALNIAFAAASEDIVTAETPRTVSVNITPDLTAGTQSKAGLTLSFNPLPGVASVQAAAGFYTMTGQDVNPVLAHFAVAAPATYAMTGTAATPKRGRSLVAAQGGYAMTGTPAVPNRSAGATGSIVYDSFVGAGAKTNGQIYTFPLTVAAASGDRLVLLGGIGDNLADLTSVTIDGQTATRVGFISRGAVNLSGNSAAFITAYRATGTANTSINVLATLSLPQAFPFYSAYCMCFHMSGVGALYQTTNNAAANPVLSTDTVANGVVAAGLLGYQATALSTVWSGLTERLDSLGQSGDEVLSVATVDTATAATPRVISATITPALTDSDDSVAAICLSFIPSGSAGSRVTADTGTYAVTGQTALTLRGRKTVAGSGSYAMTGSPVTLTTSGQIAAGVGSYAMTGKPVTLLRGGVSKKLDAGTGSYALTGTDASVAKGRKATVTTVGAYNMTGTTVATGRGLIAIAGSYAMTGTAATLTYRSGPNISLVVGSAGLTAAVGSPLIRTTVGIFVSGVGNVATVFVGGPSVLVQGGITVPVAGNPMTVSTSNVSIGIGGGIAVSVNGFGMTADVGNAVAKIPSVANVTGNFVTVSLGSAVVNVLGSTTSMIIGNQLDTSVGSVTFTTNANVSVTGNSMTASVGSVTTFSLVGAAVAGNFVTASVGTVTVSAKQNTVVNVDGNALVAFVGTLDFAGGGTITHPNLKNREGRMLQPSNWMGA